LLSFIYYQLTSPFDNRLCRLHPVSRQLRLHGAAAGLRRLGAVEVGRALHQINRPTLPEIRRKSKPFMFLFCGQLLIGFDGIYDRVRMVGSLVVLIN